MLLSSSGIVIGVDDTDHIAFFCPYCKSTLKIIRVTTKNVIIDFEHNKDNCTWINLKCPNCKRVGHRKFYWKVEDGRFCWMTTKKDFERQIVKDILKTQNKEEIKTDKIDNSLSELNKNDQDYIK